MGMSRTNDRMLVDLMSLDPSARSVATLGKGFAIGFCCALPFVSCWPDPADLGSAASRELSGVHQP
jgi:hypothetical protein